MSTWRAHYVKTRNALTLWMSGEQVRLQVPPKLYKVHSWITQIIRQWVPNCGSGDRKCPSPKGAAVNTWNRHLASVHLLTMDKILYRTAFLRNYKANFNALFSCSHLFTRATDGQNAKTEFCKLFTMKDCAFAMELKWFHHLLRVN